MNKHKSTISDDVMSQIKNGDVRMRPGIYFTLLSVSVVIFSVIAGLLMSFLSSVIFYWIKIETSNSMAYGARNNLESLISSFPWWTLPAAAGLMLFIVFLVRRYGKNYRHHLWSIILVVLLVVSLLGFGLSNLGVGNISRPGRNQQNQNGGSQRGNPWRNN